MQIDYNKIRPLFGGHITPSQFNGIEAKMKAFNEAGITDKRQVAYMLATSFHETAQEMQPIKERGGYNYLAKYDTGVLAKRLGNTPQADGDGQKYAGRGDVQLTGRANYEKFGKLLGVDLVNNPDLALDPAISAKIMIVGMQKGLFTGKSLASCITSQSCDYVNARKIINGLDDANLIAGYAKTFEAALG